MSAAQPGVNIVSIRSETPDDDRGFIPTRLYRRIEAMFDYCTAEHDTALIIGPAGVGKTASARRYVAENEGAAALITMGARARVACRPDDPAPALQQICLALGGGIAPRGGALDAHRRIVDLIRYGPDPLKRHHEDGGLAGPGMLIIDEAHAVPQAGADAIRDLADELPIGICFIGNRSLYDAWFPPRAGKRLATEQFISRIGPRDLIEDVDDDDVAAILDGRGVKGDAERAFLIRIGAGSNGHLRSMDKVLRFAASRTDGRAPRLHELEMAATLCGL